MAQAAARRRDEVLLEENGIVRSTVFPNAVRDVRVSKGFETLRSLDESGRMDLTDTRLGKIERGEIFPTADEMRSISRALGVQVGTLLLDVNEPGFDREAWARDHIEAKLANRGGGIEAMRLGAAVRVSRIAMGRSTTDMKDDFGLPAATVSRIENADRPIERWDAGTQRGIAKVLRVRGTAAVKRRVAEMHASGDLDVMLHDLFSQEAIDQRNARRLRALLSDLSGRKAARMLQHLEANDNSMVVLTGSSDASGTFCVAPSDRKVPLPDGVARGSLAVEMADPVLGPGLPRGTVVVLDPEQAPVDGDVAAIVSRSGDRIRLVSVSGSDGTLLGFSVAFDEQVDLLSLPQGSRLMRMVAAVA